MKYLLLVAAFCFATALCAHSAPLLHPKAAPLPFAHQGPFVTTADGGVVCMDSKNALRSADEGRTWTSSALFAQPEKFSVSNERALLRTREGVIISAWMNGAERKEPKGWRWGDKDVSWRDFVLPTYTCRSADDGKTWETPVKLSEPWCGCIHSLIQMRSGRIVLVGQEIIPQWRHATVMFVSDDLGKSWQRGDTLDYGIGAHDHAGSIEGSVIERKDGTLYLLLRTESGYLWEATSHDGLKWAGLKQSLIKSVTCCPQLARLADGRIALLWNAPPRHAPSSGSSRAELSLAFSDDEARTWSKPVIVAADYAPGGRVSYPYLYERKPGELWITTMQGGLRMRLHTADLAGGEIPVFKPAPAPEPKPGGIVMFGDSTTAARPGAVQKVYSVRVGEALQGIGSSLAVHNAGIGGNTTRDARKRFERDVLRHRPRVIVMQFGINDSVVDVWKTPPATGPRVAQAEYLENLRAMISAAQQQKAKVILMTTNPLRWTPKLKDMYGKPPYDLAKEDGFDSPHLAAFNDALRKLAAELGLPLVDVRAAYPAFAAKHQATIDGLLLDGMHPNDLGHQLVSEMLVPVIRDTVR
ncbi:MAG: GDSL-type esterase/lipase family protein [Chthoniobacteraceae bacterium]